MQLENISKIKIGILTSRELNEKGENKYKLFNLKNYDEKIEYEIVRTDKILNDKLTKEGDILIRLVYPNRVIYIDKELENLLIPSQMCIISPDSKILNPKYLKWYFESDLGKANILLNTTGSSIQKISVSALRKLEIPIISLEKQNAISDLIELWEKEKEVLKETIIQKELLYNNLINEIIEKEG